MKQSIFLVMAALLLAGGTAAPADQQARSAVGIDEQLGDRLPMDATFRDEKGREVTLKEVLDRPAVLSLVYYSCPGICTPLLSGVADAVTGLDLKPGKDYKVVTISFDPKDTPKLAAEKKLNYLNLIKKPFPEDAWLFLTGDQQNIDRVTEAVGFRYKKDGRDFIHPGCIYAISPEGTITRYLYGTEYLPFDVKMSLAEASEGHPSATINKVLLYCFSYDPESRSYVTNVTRIAGAAILLLVVAMVVVMGAVTRRRQSVQTASEESNGS